MNLNFIKRASLFLSILMLLSGNLLTAFAEHTVVRGSRNSENSCAPEDIVPGKTTIMDFVQLAEDVRTQSSKTQFSLPATLSAIIDGQATQIPVTWIDKNGFFDSKPPLPDTYIFTAKPADNYHVPRQVMLPEIVGTIVGIQEKIFVEAPPLTGYGTKESPYCISAPSQLQNISTLIKQHDEDYCAPGIYYQLNADIDCSKISAFPAIGTNANPFAGQFDGAGHLISNLKISASADDQGFFAAISEDAVVKNLGLVNVTVGGSNHVGGIVGRAAGKIENCFVTGTVSGADYIGGVAGKATGSITNCYSTANVSGHDYIGGVAGSAQSISYCYSTGNVSGNNDIGGLTGSGSPSQSAALNQVLNASCTNRFERRIGRVSGVGDIFTGNIAYDKMADNEKKILSEASDPLGINGIAKSALEISAPETLKKVFAKSHAWVFPGNSLPILSAILAPQKPEFKLLP